MRMKLSLSLAASTVMLFMLSVTGYGMASNSDRPEATGNIVLENRQLAMVGEKPKVSSEVLQKIAPDNPDGVAPEKAASNTGVTGNIASENPNRRAVTDSGQLDVEIENVALENAQPTWGTASARNLLVRDWLEARATERVVGREAHSSESSAAVAELIAQDMEMTGGGWCDLCGCWMRHGCDSNGNCGLGHESVCGPGYCSLHPTRPCNNSG